MSDSGALAGHVYDQERGEVVSFVPTNIASLLDVGCGGGAFGAAVRRKLGPQLRLEGAEPFPESAELALARGFDRVITGTYPECVGDDERFDCIVFNDVLEHMTDPWSALAHTRTHLNPGGVIVASLPNVLFLPVLGRVVLRRRWDYTEDGVLDRTHLRFFTRSTMVEMFERTGFRVDTVQGINNQWYTGRWGRLQPLAPLTGQYQWQQYVLVARPATRLPDGHVHR